MAGTSLRPDMVDAAVRFMTGEKVRETPMEEQERFLRNKGLTDEEIREAKERARSELALLPKQQMGVGQTMGGAVPMVYPAQSRWRDVANTVVIVGGLSYAGYKVLRKYVLPRFFGVPDPEEEQARRMEEQVNELHNSLKFVMDSVQQTLQGVQQQQESLNRALVLLAERDRSTGLSSHQMQELKTDVSVVKSLLLNRNQFAPIPNGDGPTLPAWQLQHSRRGPTSSGYTTPPTGNGTANGHPVDDDDEDDDPAPNGGVATRKSDLEDPEDDTNLAANMSTGV